LESDGKGPDWYSDVGEEANWRDSTIVTAWSGGVNPYKRGPGGIYLGGVGKRTGKKQGTRTKEEN